MEKILDRFLRYVSYDTQSCETSETQPSTDKQLKLLRLLRDELKAMGVDATLDKYGYVMGTLPATPGVKAPKLGFIAHVDTAPDASGADIKPQIIENYDGGDIALMGVPGLYLKPSEFPELLDHKGQTLITTDGTTLLGADDKAGVAEIMDAVQYLVGHPEIKHGEIKIGFTPDEEIGRGVVKFDVKKFGADYAYTMDGGEIGELEFENFNAAAATIRIQGRNVHPGYAKGKMKNAIRIAEELDSLLPVNQKPEYTEGYEGFFHLIAFNGSVEDATVTYILRDHDLELYEEKKAVVRRCVDFINSITPCASRWSRITISSKRPSGPWRWKASSPRCSPSAAAQMALTSPSWACLAPTSSPEGSISMERWNSFLWRTWRPLQRSSLTWSDCLRNKYEKTACIPCRGILDACVLHSVVQDSPELGRDLER